MKLQSPGKSNKETKMRYLKIIIITIVISIIMEFFNKFLIKKYGMDKTLSIMKTIAIVAIAMFLKEVI